MTPPTPPCPTAPLSLAILSLNGADARAFLNGQCSQQVASLAVGADTTAAILNAQGRVLAFVYVRSVEEGLRLLLPADLAEAIRSHLSRYVLRAKVRLAVELPTPEDLAAPMSARQLSGCEEWALGSIRSGLPEVTARTSGEWIPQMLNLDRLGAISFDKGCYTGQEIVARTQHLGRIKRRMRRYRLSGAQPEALDGLFSGTQKVGEVVVSAQAGDDIAEFLAVVSLDAEDLPLHLADGRPCLAAPLPYSTATSP